MTILQGQQLTTNLGQCWRAHPSRSNPILQSTRSMTVNGLIWPRLWSTLPAIATSADHLGFRCATCVVIFHSFMNKCGFGFGLILLWLIRALSNVVIIARRFVNSNKLNILLICDWIYKKLKWPLCLWSAFETVDDRDY